MTGRKPAGHLIRLVQLAEQNRYVLIEPGAVVLADAIDVGRQFLAPEPDAPGVRQGGWPGFFASRSVRSPSCCMISVV
jgi:hypothetical protein